MLFRRVILMSGSALAPWARASSPTNTSRALALSLSCPSSPPHLVVECLRNISIYKVVCLLVYPIITQEPLDRFASNV